MPFVVGIGVTAGSVGTPELADNAVTNAKAADMATARFKARATAATGDPEDLTGTQATALLDAVTSALKGLAPASGGGTTNFLRADATWAAPPAGGSGNAVAASLAFGASFTDKAQTVVTGQAWVTGTSKITAQVLCPAGVDPDEMYLLDFQPVVSDLVVGTGFTVTLYSQPLARGTYTVNCIGV